MYKIIKGETTLGFAESPVFVAKMDNGCYGLMPERDAKGICYNGTVYNIETKDPIDENLETVKVLKVDAGQLLKEEATQLQADIDFLAATKGVAL